MRLDLLTQQQKLERRKATVEWERQRVGLDSKGGEFDTEGKGGGVEDTVGAIASSSEDRSNDSEKGSRESRRDETKTAGMMKNTKYHIQEEQNRSFYDALDRRID